MTPRLALAMIPSPAMRALRSLVCSFGLAASLVAPAACDKPRPHVSIDLVGFGKEIQTRESEVFAGPKVTAAMNELLSAVGREPALAAAGSKLFDRVGQDPQVASAAQAVMGKLTSSPEIQRIVVQVMAEHPGATPDQIGELVGAKFSAVWDSPEVTPAFSKAFDQMIAGLHARDRFETVVAKTGGRLDAYLAAPDRVDRWATRLRELNGGSEPDTTQATKLYFDHAWSAERIETFAIKLLANPTVRREAAATFAEVLEQPAFDAQLRQVVTEVASDPALQAGAVQLMLMLMRSPVPTAELETQLRQLLTAPAVTKGLDKLIALLFDDPKIAVVVGVHLDKLTADPAIRADFDELIDHW